MLSRTLTGCLANLIGHAEAAEQDRGRRGKIRRLGVLAFSSEANAREFVAASKLDVSDVVALASSDAESIAGLIAQVKKRLVRNNFFTPNAQ